MAWPNYHPMQKKGENRSHVMSRLKMGQKPSQIAKDLGISRARVGQIRDMELRDMLSKGWHYLDLLERYHLRRSTLDRIMEEREYTQYRDEQRDRKKAKRQVNIG